LSHPSTHAWLHPLLPDPGAILLLYRACLVWLRSKILGMSWTKTIKHLNSELGVLKAVVHFFEVLLLQL
jgi:hypothetical protein